MSPTAIGVGIILALGLGGGGYVTYRWQEVRVLKAEQKAKDNERAATQAAIRVKTLSEALTTSTESYKKQKQELIQSQKDSQLFQSAFEALYAQSQIAKDWSNTPIPDSIRCLRRRLDPSRPSTDPSLSCPDKSNGPDTGTAPRRQDERKAPNGESSRSERLTQLQ